MCTQVIIVILDDLLLECWCQGCEEKGGLVTCSGYVGKITGTVFIIHYINRIWWLALAYQFAQ